MLLLKNGFLEKIETWHVGLSCQYTHFMSFSSKSEHDTVADQATLSLLVRGYNNNNKNVFNMGCKFGSSVVLLSGGSQNFQPKICTQNFLSTPGLAPTNVVPCYKFHFEKWLYIQIIWMPQLLATACQKCVFIWQDSFAVMTSNLNFIVRPILQLFVIALYALIQPLNRKITKMVLHLSRLSLHLKSYHENYSIKITPVFGNDR